MRNSVKDISACDARRFIIALYKGVLRRFPSEEEIDAWVSKLTSTDVAHYLSLEDTAEFFINCDEFKYLTKNEEASKSAINLFCEPGHFYSPIVDIDSVRPFIDKIRNKKIPESLPGISIDRERMISAWEKLLPHLRACPFTPEARQGFRYQFENPAYSYADGATLFAMIRRHRPRRIIEIGCGWSSACILDTIDRELNGDCEVTFIEPYPELLHNLTSGQNFSSRIIGLPVQSVPLEEFTRLESGDILFIDSTHVLKTGSDVAYELLDIIPRLVSGVLVHIHDIFWPFEYPDHWIFDENRSWNELYALRAFLINNSEWQVHFFGNYMTSVERERVLADFPLMLRNPGGAIWLRKC